MVESAGDVARKVAVLEERMKTMQAEYKTDIALLAKQMAENQTRLLLAIAAMIAVGVTILGLVLS